MGLEEARETIRMVDEKMAALFVERMNAACDIAAYKREHGLPIEDKTQEQRVLERCGSLVEDAELRPFYLQFQQATMDVSKDWQRHLTDEADAAEANGAGMRADEQGGR